MIIIAVADLDLVDIIKTDLIQKRTFRSAGLSYYTSTSCNNNKVISQHAELSCNVMHTFVFIVSCKPTTFDNLTRSIVSIILVIFRFYFYYCFVFLGLNTIYKMRKVSVYI